MATIVNNPTPREERTIVETTDSSGWAVAVIVLLAVVALGVYFWFHYRTPADTENQPGSATINVTLPTGSQNNSNSGNNNAAQ